MSVGKLMDNAPSTATHHGSQDALSTNLPTDIHPFPTLRPEAPKLSLSIKVYWTTITTTFYIYFIKSSKKCAAAIAQG